MEDTTALNKRILDLTLMMKERYPELYGFLGEMPVTLPIVQHPGVTEKTLQDYYSSLLALLEKYSVNYKKNV